jgi:hypothetical protein
VTELGGAGSGGTAAALLNSVCWWDCLCVGSTRKSLRTRGGTSLAQTASVA